MKSISLTLFSIKLLLLTLTIPSYASTPSTIDFFNPVHMRMASLNPTGEHIAAIIKEDDTQRVILINSQNQQRTVLLDLAEFSDKESSVGQLVWLDDNNIALTFIEIRKGNENIVDSKIARKMLILSLAANAKNEIKVNIREIRTDGKLVNPLPNQNNQLLYAKNGHYSKIYNIKINKLNRYKQKLSKLQRIDGGQFKKSNEVAKIKGYAKRWFFDQQGQANAVVHVSDEDILSLSIFKEDNTTEAINYWVLDLNDSEFTSKTLMPIAQGDNPNIYYCLDLAERLNQTIYKVNFATDEEEVVYQSTAYDILDVDLTPDRTQLQMVRVINDGNVEHIYVNNDKQEHLTGSDYQNAALISKVSQNSDDTKAIFYIESHNQPGQYILKDGQTFTLLGGYYPKLNHQLASELHEGEVEVEGLSIPYLLTLPAQSNKAKKDRQHPLIVMPHGGPIGIYDNKYFDPVNELLAAHGYAVLRVNFRGSGGYSKAFKEAGMKQYGELMLEDIYQATLKVTKRDDIGAQKVCIFGSSYGGYAAATLTIKYPQTYQCGATFSGVSDLNLQISGTNSTKKLRKWYTEHVGDTKTDYDKLKQQSPVYLAKNLKRPLMIYHGGEDDIVLPEQAFRLKLMLEKYQKPFEWHFNDEAGHNTGKPEQSAEIHESLLAFFARYLK